LNDRIHPGILEAAEIGGTILIISPVSLLKIPGGRRCHLRALPASAGA